jgi:hypothetical protein
MKDTGTRTDCTRDNRRTICPNSRHFGSSSNVAKRGCWIMYEIDNYHHAGRVVGRVHCEGKTYLEIISVDVAMTYACVRWIDPACVYQCYPSPHTRLIEFMVGEWTDAEIILHRATQGFVRKELMR